MFIAGIFGGTLKDNKKIRRAVVLIVAGLLVPLVAPTNAAAAAPTTGVSLEYDSNVSTLRESASEAACPVPGDRVQVSGSPAIYLIDPEYDLNWVPSEAVYNNLFDTWSGRKTFNNLFTECYWAYFRLNDGHLAKRTSSDPARYIYQEAVGGYRHIVNLTVFNRYNFNESRVQVRSVSPIRADWYR